MANATLKQIIAKRRLAEEQSTQQSEDTNQQETAHIDEQETIEEVPDVAPSDEVEQEPSIPDEAGRDDEEDNQNDKGQSDKGKSDNQDKKKEDDFKRKFERLSGKMSKTEKERNEAKAEAERLRKEAEELRARLAVREELKSSQQSLHDDDVDYDDEDDEGFIWGNDDYSDDEDVKPAKKNRKSKSEKPKAEEDIDSKVEAVLARREKERQEKAFIKEMDNVISSLGEQSNFVELANEPTFIEFINKKRTRKAIFNDALTDIDKESVDLLKELVTDYLGKNTEPVEKPKSNTSVSVQKNRNAPKQKSNVISEAQYQQAVRDMGKASKRKQARAIVRAYKKQQEE